MTYVGGIRARMIYDSLYSMIQDSLESLDWFDSVSSHKDVSFPYESVENDTEIPLNTLAISDSGADDEEFELGSNMGEVTWTMYLDFYAEDKQTGIHLINDVKDILLGRMPAIGRSHPVLEVYDYSLATPVEIFYCDIENVIVDKANNFPEPYRQHWYTCRFTLVDHYGG